MPELDLNEHVRFEFTMNEAIYRRYWEFSFFKGQDPKKKKFWFLAIMLLTPAILWFDFYHYGIEFGDYLYVLDIFDWAFAFLPLILVTALWFVFKTGGKRAYKKLSIVDARFTYDFGPDRVFITTTSSLQNGSNETLYTMFHKVYETQTDFYLYINKTMAFVVDKASLIEGQIGGLRLNLQSHLKQKYVLCK